MLNQVGKPTIINQRYILQAKACKTRIRDSELNRNIGIDARCFGLYPKQILRPFAAELQSQWNGVVPEGDSSGLGVHHKPLDRFDGVIQNDAGEETKGRNDISLAIQHSTLVLK